MTETEPMPAPDGFDEITKPVHYNSHPSGVECITVVEHMTYNVGAAMKYLWRAGLKPGNDTLKDLRKAEAYVRYEIARVERQRGRTS